MCFWAGIVKPLHVTVQSSAMAFSSFSFENQCQNFCKLPTALALAKKSLVSG